MSVKVVILPWNLLGGGADDDVVNGHRPANKGRRYPAELVTEAEIRALIRAGSAKAPTGIRNRALIAVLYRGGLQISEALALYPKDVDQAVGTVAVLHGKGDRRRTVGMGHKSTAR